MATKNIVPNADSEGGIGTSSKYWATGFIDAITTTGNLAVGGNIQIPNDGTIGSAGTAGALTISSGGDVGIGENNPTRRKLEIKGASAGIVLHDSDVTNLSHEIIAGGNHSLEIHADYNNVAANSKISFNVDGALAASFNDNGNLLMASGNAIFFGNSNNGLDAFEEGNWTNPQIQGGTTSGTISGGTIISHYTRIGNLVHAYVRFNGVTVSNASGGIKITGLPFAEKTSTFPPTANFGINGLPKTSGSTQYFYVQGSALYGYEFNVGGSGSSWSIPTTATYYADISITYQV